MRGLKIVVFFCGNTNINSVTENQKDVIICVVF